MSARTTEMQAQLTGDANGAVAAIEKVKVRVQETARAAESANTKVGQSTEFLVSKSEKAAKGVAAITQALYAMEAEGSARVLALGQSVGNFADLMGPGGKVVSGIAIVTSAIVALFMQAKEKSAEATKAIEEDLTRLVNAGDFAAITKRLQEIERGTAGGKFEDGRAAIRARIAALQDEYNAVGKTNRYYLERAEKIGQEREQLQKLNAEYDRYYQALTDPKTSAGGARGVAGAPITTTADSNEAIAASAKKAADRMAELERKAREAFEALKKDAVTTTQQTVKSLEALNDEMGKRLTREAELREDQQQSSATRARTIADLTAELRAVTAGREAYDALLDSRARAAAGDAAVAEAEQLALRDAKSLTADKKLEIRQAAEFAYDLQQAIAGMVASLHDAGAGELAMQLASVAESATQIATSLGDAGRNIARVAAIAGPLFRGLGGIQDAVQKRGADGKVVAGQSVGMLDALRGKNGADSQAKALAGSVAIVGAVVGIADAMDLFGTRAAQKAREMREAARAFSLALQDFVAEATQEGPAGERIRQLRRQADDLRRQAIAAGGGTADTIDGELTSERLRAMAAQVRADAGEIAEKSARGAAQLRTIADGFDDVADALARNEEAAKEAVLRQLEDLEVRKLAAAGLTEEAARRREAIELQRAQRAADDAKLDIDKEYTAALVAVVIAENAAAEALRKRTAALQTLDSMISVLGLKPQEALQATIGAVSNLSPQIAAIFDGLDLTTRDGLTEVQTRLRDLFRTLNADGVISEAEQPIVELIQRLLGVIGTAMEDLGAGLAEALDIEAIRAEVFGYNASERFARLRNALAGRFAELDAIFQDPALQGETNLGALKDALQNKIAALLEGGITDDEAPLLAALRQLLGLVVTQIDDAAADADAEAERIAGEQAAARGARRGRAGLRAQLYDLDGADAFRATLDGYGESFANLFAQFDPRTQEGIDGASSKLASIFEELDNLTDDEILARFGMTRDELNTAIAQLDGDLDGLGNSLKGVAADAQAAADAAREFADSIATQFIRASQGDQAADLAQAAETRDEQRAEARAKGLGDSMDGMIEAIYQDAVRRINTRYAPDVEAAAGGRAGDVGDAAPGTRPRSRSAQVSGDLGGLSEVTGQSLAGQLAAIVYNTGERGAIVGALLGRLGPAPSLASLSFPSYPTATAGAGGIMIGPITVHIGSVAPGGMTPAQAGTAAAQAITAQVLEQLGRDARAEVRFLGSNRRIRGR